MKFLFDDESFSFETLRAAGIATYGGADLGEVIVTAGTIPDGDEDAWLNAWKATAQHVHALGQTSLDGGHHVNAREALLRASTYYRTAEFFRRHDPAEDPEVRDLSRRSRDTFVTAMGLFDLGFEAVDISYEDTTLPGYLYLVDDSGTPTIVYTSGYDSRLEEFYLAIAAAALARGYNGLAVDGPRHGAALREQHVVMRPDWEAVITPVIDFALTRTDVAPTQVASFGCSLGGYLVARAAAFDRRIAALILDDGIYDFHTAITTALPPFLRTWIDDGNDQSAIPVLKMLMAVNTPTLLGAANGLWVMGLDTLTDLPPAFGNYTLAGIADRITAAVLVLDAENASCSRRTATGGGRHDSCRRHRATLTESEGAGEHCHMGAMARAHHTIFDWLDTTRAQRI